VVAKETDHSFSQETFFPGTAHAWLPVTVRRNHAPAAAVMVTAIGGLPRALEEGRANAKETGSTLSSVVETEILSEATSPLSSAAAVIGMGVVVGAATEIDPTGQREKATADHARSPAGVLGAAVEVAGYRSRDAVVDASPGEVTSTATARERFFSHL